MSNIANYFALTVDNVDPNGRIRTKEHFDYTLSSGYSSFSHNLTLVLEMPNIATLNGMDAKTVVTKYLTDLCS